VKAILMSHPGDADVLYIGETPAPTPGEHELLVKVHATALNRADLLQRMGGYPPPPGASDILGLEMAGEIVGIGSNVTRWELGHRVCALLPGGGYASYVVIPEDMAMPIPDNLSYEQAAAIPEVFLTAYLNLFWLGGFAAGKTVLIHAGASGVGTAAIQLVREASGHSVVTAGSADKIARCLELGATAGWNYHDGAFSPWVKEQTGGTGVNVILDFIGGPYFQDNIQSLAMDGRLVVIGTMGGAEVPNVNLGYLLFRRLQVIGTALRSRPIPDKIRLTQEFVDFAYERFATDRLQPVIDSVFDWKDVAQAHKYMESNQNTGKIVLRVGE
jgi:tumor protein p53-inducible protein 3